MNDSQPPARTGETIEDPQDTSLQPEAEGAIPTPDFATNADQMAEASAPIDNNAAAQPKKPRRKSAPKQQNKETSNNATDMADDGSEIEEKDTSPLGVIVARNAFYRDGYRLWLTVAALEGFALLCMAIAMIVLIAIHQPENKYFATTEDGRVVPMVPLNQPNLSKPALM